MIRQGPGAVTGAGEVAQWKSPIQWGQTQEQSCRVPIEGRAAREGLRRRSGDGFQAEGTEGAIAPRTASKGGGAQVASVSAPC